MLDEQAETRPRQVLTGVSCRLSCTLRPKFGGMARCRVVELSGPFNVRSVQIAPARVSQPEVCSVMRSAAVCLPVVALPPAVKLFDQRMQRSCRSLRLLLTKARS